MLAHCWEGTNSAPFKQCDGYDGDGGGGDEGAGGDGRAGKGGEGVRRRRQGRGWMEAQMAAAVRAVAARVAGGEGGVCDSGGGVGGHEGGGAGADGHVGDDHQAWAGRSASNSLFCSHLPQEKGKRSRERLRVAGSGGKRATQCRLRHAGPPSPKPSRPEPTVTE